VYPSFRYHALGHDASQLEANLTLIGAPDLWGGPSFPTAGNGMKIGIIDDGVDQRHKFFDPRGMSMPPRFPNGQQAYTTAKVIVARAFAPRKPKWRYANRPFDPLLSEHGTHVAGIAAGEHDVDAGTTTLSGVAPNAWIGNYKVLSIPTQSGVGPDGNSPEIARGIEAAVRDGMDVINLSLGEPEIDPKRDIVVKAIDGAAAAGVVPTIAAGNDLDSFGYGSVGSPANAPGAIAAAAVSTSAVVASFSSAGPTPVSLQMKPEVSAPGVNVLSSVPVSDGTWDEFSGTSMAAPHVAGAAALLRERHPEWTVEQIKSALVLTGRPAYPSISRASEALPTREGGGIIYLPDADRPLIFAKPATLSFGYLHPGQTAERHVAIADAGGGSGPWTVSVDRRSGRSAVSFTAPSSVTVPGTLTIRASARAEGECAGFIVLTSEGAQRRVPFWLRVTEPRLARHRHGTLRRTGTYRGDNRRQQALVDTYRYPDDPRGVGIPLHLLGPEQVFRLTLKRPVANFGVALVGHASGVEIQPRVVAAGDENRLTGYPALPVNLNPYLPIFLRPERAAGAILPAAGSYDIVFDSTSAATAGPFRFRFWIGDTTPPAVRLVSRSARPGGTLRFRVTDRGSGVDPSALFASIDGNALIGVSYSPRTHLAALPLSQSLPRGRHRVLLQASDYQESRNMEDVGPILPNTRRLSTSFRIR
jgi:subtilisin family serine protease